MNRCLFEVIELVFLLLSLDVSRPFLCMRRLCLSCVLWGFFYVGNLFIVQFREPWLGVWFRFSFCKTPSMALLDDSRLAGDG